MNKEQASQNPATPPILWHHGTCDCCRRRLTLVCHFGYNTQPGRDYRMCFACLSKHIQTITFGWMAFKVDNTINRLWPTPEEEKEEEREEGEEPKS